MLIEMAFAQTFKHVQRFCKESLLDGRGSWARGGMWIKHVLREGQKYPKDGEAASGTSSQSCRTRLMCWDISAIGDATVQDRMMGQRVSVWISAVSFHSWVTLDTSHWPCGSSGSPIK